MPTDQPLISIIIPCYNYGSYIPEALDSILAQTYKNWEIIIVDDGSKDNTAEVVQPYLLKDSRITYHQQANRGVSAARNAGLTLAKGAYIQFIDADDYIAPEKLALHAGRLAEQPAIDLVFGDTYNFQHTASPEGRQFVPMHMHMGAMSGQGQLLAMHMAHDNIFLIGTPLFRKTLADRIGFFDESLVSFEDWHYWYRGALQGAMYVHDNRPGTEFYVRTHGNNTTGNRYRMWKNKIQTRQRLIQKIEEIKLAGGNKELDFNALLAKHKELRYEEQARFELLYHSLGKGLLSTLQYFRYGTKPGHIWYDSAYWIKERLLGRNKISA